MKLTRQFTTIATGLLAVGLFVGPTLAAQPPTAADVSLAGSGQPVAAATPNSTAVASSQAATTGASASSDAQPATDTPTNTATPMMYLPSDVKPIDPSLPIVISPTPPGDPQPTPIDPIPTPTPPRTPREYFCPVDGRDVGYHLESDAPYYCPPVDLRR